MQRKFSPANDRTPIPKSAQHPAVTTRQGSSADALPYQTVGSRIGKDHPRRELFRLLEIHRGVGDDDYHIPHSRLTGRSTVQAHLSAAAFTPDGISFDAFAVVHVHNLHLLAGKDVGSLEQSMVTLPT